MKKYQRIMMSISLVMSMALSVICPTIGAAADENEQSADVVYVAIGDSMTTGYGLSDEEKSYSQIIQQGIEAKGYTVEGRMLADNGMRLEELRYLLEYGKNGGYQGDEITENFNFTATDAAYYKDSINKADYISLALGTNNYMSSFVRQTIGMFGKLAGMEDVGLIGGTEFKLDLNGTLSVGNATIDNMINGLFTQLEDRMISLLEGVLKINISGNEKYVGVIKQFVGNLSYAVGGILTQYNACLNDILTMNDDVNLVLVGLPNILSGVKLTFDFQDINMGDFDLREYLNSLAFGPINLGALIGLVDTTITLDFGTILDVVIGSTNSYINTLVTTYNTEKIFTQKKYKLSMTTINNADLIGNHFGDENKIEEYRGEFLQSFSDAIKLPAKILESNTYIKNIIEGLDESTSTKIKHIISMVDQYTSCNKHANISECYSAYDGTKTIDFESLDSEALAFALYNGLERVMLCGAGKNSIDVNKLLVEFKTVSQSIGDLRVADVTTYDSLSGLIEDILCGKKKAGEEVFTAIPALVYNLVKLTVSNNLGAHLSEEGHRAYADSILEKFNIKQKNAPVQSPIVETVTTVVNTVSTVVNNVVATVNNAIGNVVSSVIGSVIGGSTGDMVGDITNTITNTVTTVVNVISTSIIRIFSWFGTRIW